MISLAAPFAIVAALLLSAAVGPVLVRQAAPVLMRAPRLATALLLGGLTLWLAAAAAASLVLALVISGPRVLPGPYGDVCQRCLAAASPFGQATMVETTVPVAAVVLLPLLAALGILTVGTTRLVRGLRADREFTARIRDTARPMQVQGHRVLLIADDRPVAFALPRRSGGIVISDGLRHELSTAELTAVLEHESAHVRQHHHLILALLKAFACPLRLLPLFRTVADAVPHYLEIAADDVARRSGGTPALAAALLKIGAPQPWRGAALQAGGVPTHGAGPDRIRHLVAPDRSWVALGPFAALVGMTLVLAVISLTAHGRYLHVVLSGCTLPL